MEYVNLNAKATYSQTLVIYAKLVTVNAMFVSAQVLINVHRVMLVTFCHQQLVTQLVLMQLSIKIKLDSYVFLVVPMECIKT